MVPVALADVVVPHEQAPEQTIVVGGITQTVKQSKKKGENELEGFGIVTLASLFPVLFVQLLAISLTGIYSEQDIFEYVDP